MSETERHTIIALVDNEPGVLARVVGLFSGRGYNIESLTVSSVSVDESLSRMTIVTSGTPMIIEQIKAQLNKLVPIHTDHDLTAEGAHLEREIALVKVVASGPERRESLRIADILNATVADTTTESFVFSLTGKPEKVDAFIELMRSLGRTEIARSGVVGIARGAKAL